MLESMPDHDLAQRRVLDTLLAAHPRMLGIDELTAQAQQRCRASATRCACSSPTGSRRGSATASALSRAAVRFDALSRG